MSCFVCSLFFDFSEAVCPDGDPPDSGMAKEHEILQHQGWSFSLNRTSQIDFTWSSPVDQTRRDWRETAIITYRKWIRPYVQNRTRPVGAPGISSREWVFSAVSATAFDPGDGEDIWKRPSQTQFLAILYPLSSTLAFRPVFCWGDRQPEMASLDLLTLARPGDIRHGSMENFNVLDTSASTRHTPI